MDESVTNYFTAPLLIHSGFKPGSRFTQIAVDSQIATAAGNQKFDVVFVGTGLFLFTSLLQFHSLYSIT